MQSSQITKAAQGAAQAVQDIHDIKPPVPIGIDPFIIKAVIIGVILFLCLIAGYFLFRYIRKKLIRNSKDNNITLSPEIPADEAALKELESISDLMMTNPRLYYFRLTALVQNFIGRIFNINAPEMTTQEIVAAINTLAFEKDKINVRHSKYLQDSKEIKNSSENEKTAEQESKKYGIERSMIAPAREFFLSSSIVKYAAVIPKIEQMKSDENFIKDFIYSVMNSAEQSNGQDNISNRGKK